MGGEGSGRGGQEGQGPRGEGEEECRHCDVHECAKGNSDLSADSYSDQEWGLRHN